MGQIPLQVKSGPELIQILPASIEPAYQLLERQLATRTRTPLWLVRRTIPAAAAAPRAAPRAATRRRAGRRQFEPADGLSVSRNKVAASAGSK